MTDPPTLQAALATHFGHAAFREGQEAVIRAVMAGQDCLAVMPTGGGKSLCFQLPAVLRPGVTLVISPLIALMKDQVDGLVQAGIAATYVNSTLSASERRDRLEGIAAGRYDLVYVAPERFRSPRFLGALGRVRVSLFAVDEAHCVSMWGHDFRPDYLQLAQVLPRLGDPQVLCLTATATPEVRQDVAAQLGLGVPPRGPLEVVVRGFARPGLTLAVTRVRGREDKYQRARELLGELGTGIVYCATRRSVEGLTERLRADGCSCVGYHAGMTDEVRRETQERFVSGEARVVVATNAFGMGIDRADVRAIIHWEIPGSLESYYQEAGRAGRDGQPARCELLYNYADVRTQEFFIEGANPSPALVRAVGSATLRLAGVAGAPVSVAEVTRRVAPDGRANQMAVETAFGILGRLDVLARVSEPGDRQAWLAPGPAADGLDRLDLDFLEEKAARDRARLLRLLHFVNVRDCRHATILRYFGDPAATGVCGNRCDNCLRQSGRARLGGRAPTEAEWVQVQKALSCVARLRARFGRTRVAQVLAGSRDQAVLRVGLDQHQSWGSLAELSLGAVRTLLDALEEAGCVVTVGDEYPTLRLTELGRQVMRREVDVSLVLPEPPRPAAPKPRARRGVGAALAAADPGETDAEAARTARLAEALQSWRREQARALGVPAYRILTNATLADLARARPADRATLLAVKGIGPAKLDAHGEAILALVREHADVAEG